MGRDQDSTTRINLGNLNDPKSHLGKTLTKLPDGEFHKAKLNKFCLRD